MTMLDRMRRHSNWLKWSLALVCLSFVLFYIPDFLRGASGVDLAAADTVAFGDGENDVELVRAVGYGVAVANAHERVLEVADFVCPRDRDEGVAQVIEAFLDWRP